MKNWFILIFCLCTTCLSAQVLSIEEWRQKGYEARVGGDFDLAVTCYKNVHAELPGDYDAMLALARLHTWKGDFDSAIQYYQMMLDSDDQDWEALNGMGRCYMQIDKLDESIAYHKRAVFVRPDHVPGYLELAKMLSWNGDLDEAIEVYENANKQDPTYAEVWAGMGKMYFWQGKSYTAIDCYRKAAALDPTNLEIAKELKQVEQTTKGWLSGQGMFLQEKEPSYVINALVQRYTFSKKLTDHLHLRINGLFDHSDRDFTGLERDTTRWYISSGGKISWTGENHNFGIYASYSPTDEVWSSYGISWRMTYRFGDFKFSNNIDAGYQYFYYWNTVGRKIFNENLTLKWKKWETNLGLSIGKVDAKPVSKFREDVHKIGTNPFRIYSISLNYQLFKNPVVKIGGKYSYTDFEFFSPSYYSPYDRILYGPVMSIYLKNKKWYGYARFNYNLGEETIYVLAPPDYTEYVSDQLDADNWSGSISTGYNWPSFTLSVGGSHFYNPYYENWIAYITLAKSF